MEEQPRNQALINNDFYNELSDRWYTAYDHPIALLRAENAIRAPWVNQIIQEHFSLPCKILDVGCGGGFLSNDLASWGHRVTGIDISLDSLEVAKRHDKTRRVEYLYGDAYSLPFPDSSFDVVCAMDILEHVDYPGRLISEASRVLKPGGLFFFHTFNRTFKSQLIIIKGVEWFVKNAPENMHVYEMFITPDELTGTCTAEHLHVEKIVGLMPVIKTWSVFKMLFTHEVPKDFTFQFVDDLSTGYCGYAIKNIQDRLQGFGDRSKKSEPRVNPHF